MDGRRCEYKSHSVHHGEKCLLLPVIKLHYSSPSKKKSLLLSLYQLHSFWTAFEIESRGSFETLGITHPTTLPHLPKDLNLQITHTSAQSTVLGALRQKMCLHETVALIWPTLTL